MVLLRCNMQGETFSQTPWEFQEVEAAGMEPTEQYLPPGTPPQATPGLSHMQALTDTVT